MTALEHTGLCFTDLVLRGARCDLDRLGRPRPISGNFASVFSVTAGTGRRYAVKCFTRMPADQEERYQAISRHLATLNASWKMEFEYVRRGVLVNGRWYPMLKMEWVGGVGLIPWIEGHLADRAALERLAEEFARVAAELESHQIGHGDLQHGNLLVSASGELRLVDYDGMFVPALVGRRATEEGHRNYQSPKRTSGDFGPVIDRFSAGVIYLALIAVARDPSLWHELHPRGGEQLLVGEHDYAEPDGSAAFRRLLAHPSQDVRDLATLVSAHTRMPLDQVGALTAVAPRRSGGVPTWLADRSSAPPVKPTKLQALRLAWLERRAERSRRDFARHRERLQTDHRASSLAIDRHHQAEATRIEAELASLDDRFQQALEERRLAPARAYLSQVPITAVPYIGQVPAIVNSLRRDGFHTLEQFGGSGWHCQDRWGDGFYEFHATLTLWTGRTVYVWGRNLGITMQHIEALDAWRTAHTQAAFARVADEVPRHEVEAVRLDFLRYEDELRRQMGEQPALAAARQRELDEWLTAELAKAAEAERAAQDHIGLRREELRQNIAADHARRTQRK